ncbi:hypothetical protein CONPUDRAFT_142687 [Coniophora puteana RWD-64-598 SS2]|uniref:Putative gamma-glutamylcyclotransferase n=1 Tax=Coniophora puteana (strain RWD-64-598) TaxID=741705 RepID=A0A5M3MYY9_CONPW|nr:uncharacterized protein CONPUDRAFT_142687 [Coniophora puteana RWD-64-598 SS2]EIW84373.1 hypothetical protein CONPUDRAFT_142687 [Coniophora puteana RWD-64-598 SS2]
MASAFFYGTLIHPDILRRVIGNDGSHLQVCPAILFDYTRHKVSWADYPGIVPYKNSRSMFSRELTEEERSVRGTMVTGLTERDIRLLDVFEGDEYNRVLTQVYTLTPLTALASAGSTNGLATLVPANPPPLPARDQLGEPVHAQTYVWRPEMLGDLVGELWSFDAFVRDNAWKWLGKGSRDNADYALVDATREPNGGGYDVPAKEINGRSR